MLQTQKGCSRVLSLFTNPSHYFLCQPLNKHAYHTDPPIRWTRSLHRHRDTSYLNLSDHLWRWYLLCIQEILTHVLNLSQPDCHCIFSFVVDIGLNPSRRCFLSLYLSLSLSATSPPCLPFPLTWGLFLVLFTKLTHSLLFNKLLVLT